MPPPSTRPDPVAGWNDPAHRLDRTRLERLFRHLDVQLGIAKANRPAGTTPAGPLTIVVCGGAAMCYKDPERGTGDIDIIHPRMPPELSEAARHVRHAHNLHPDWLNDAPQIFADHPPEAASVTLHDGPNLKVKAPDNRYLLGMKLHAARDGDENDALWLMAETGIRSRRGLHGAAARVAEAIDTPWKPSRAQRDFIRDCARNHRRSLREQKRSARETRRETRTACPGTCGAKVKPTGRPCRLTAGHRGRHRSILPSRR